MIELPSDPPNHVQSFLPSEVALPGPAFFLQLLRELALGDVSREPALREALQELALREALQELALREVFREPALRVHSE
jgi:hypothetical protein